MEIQDIITKIHSLLTTNLPIRTGKSPKGWTTFDCAMCTDSRKRAGIKQTGSKISYHCFNCNYTTGWQPGLPLGKKYRSLAQRLGCDQQRIGEAQLMLLKHSEILEEQSEGIETYVPGQALFPRIPLPADAQLIEDLDEDHPLRLYAIERGVFGLFPLLAIDDDKWEDRLVIPYMYNEELVGLTGRLRAPTSRYTPKYLNETPSDYVFNIDAFSTSERDIVVVTEGVLDAIVLDCVSVCGNEITAEQAHLIERLGKRVILCPDKDQSGKALIKQALALGWEISFPPWEHCKDATEAVKEYGRLLTLASVIKYSNTNPLKSEVMMRMSM